MNDSYQSLCDDFYLDMYINTELDLPTERDTILTFFERIQRQFPSMGLFYRREKNEYCLEENSNEGQYRWVSLETDRIGCGAVNPSSCEDSYTLARLIIELAPYMLSVNHLDINSLDVTFGMDFECSGNHDEVIAEVFGSDGFNCLSEIPQAKAINFSPAMVTALSEDCCTQGRISIKSKTSIYEPGKRAELEDKAISLSFTIRQYPKTTEKFDALNSFEYQHSLAEEIMDEKIIPCIVRPLTNTITQKRLT